MKEKQMHSTRTASTARRTCVILAAVLVTATACSSNSASDPGGSAAGDAGCAAPSTVVFADNPPINVLAVRPVAEGMHAFDPVEKACHTTIKVVEYGNASGIINALVGGQADIASASALSFAKVEAQGEQMQIVFSAFIGGGAVLIGRKQYEASRGSDIAKYSGGTFGYPDPSGSCAFFTQAAAEHAGLNWASQKRVAFGSNSAAPATLSSGRADILCTDPSTAAAAVAAGSAYVVFNTNDQSAAVPVLGLQLGGVYGMTKSFVDKYPVLTQKLVDAFYKALKAIQAVASDPAKVLALYPEADQGPLSRGWNQSWPLVAPAITENDGSMPQKAIDDTLAFDQKVGLLGASQIAAIRAMFNNTFIEKAHQGN
jgi:ABC-type nitrate/sulfonate/bicarbonate transport system substrate-binding protein